MYPKLLGWFCTSNLHFVHKCFRGGFAELTIFVLAATPFQQCDVAIILRVGRQTQLPLVNETILIHDDPLHHQMIALAARTPMVDRKMCWQEQGCQDRFVYRLYTQPPHHYITQRFLPHTLGYSQIIEATRGPQPRPVEAVA